MIVLMAGLPGTGKSTLARELAARASLDKPGRVLSKDEFRHAIFPADEIEYSTRQDDFCLELMLKTAEFLLERDRERVVFLDGRTFSRRYQIESVLSAASRMGQQWRILECVCSEETARRRLEADAVGRVHPAGNRDWKLYLDVKARFEAIVHAKTVIDTDRAFEECVRVGLNAVA